MIDAAVRLVCSSRAALTVMAVAFVGGGILVAYSLVERDRVFCRGQNASIEATKEVLRVSFLGPHRFNAPIDIKQRHDVYMAQVKKLDEAECQ